VNLLKGEFNIQGVDGQGTTIVVRLPVVSDLPGSIPESIS
jgi:hypothetical protein